MRALLFLRGSQMVASFLYHGHCFPGLRGAEGTFLTSQSCSQVTLSLLPKTPLSFETHFTTLCIIYYTSLLQPFNDLGVP